MKRGFLWKFLSEEIFSVSLFIGRVNRKGRVTAGQIADCGFPLPRWQRYFEFIFKNTRRHSICPYGNKNKLNEISAHLENLFGGDTKRSLGRKRGMKRHRQLREEGSGNAGRSPPIAQRETHERVRPFAPLAPTLFARRGDQPRRAIRWRTRRTRRTGPSARERRGRHRQLREEGSGNAGRSPPPSRRERRTKGYAHSRHSPQHYSLDAVTSPVARYDGGQGERGARARQRAL